MLIISILNNVVKEKNPGGLNPRCARGRNNIVKAVSFRKDYQGGFGEHLPYLLSQEFAYAVGIKRPIFCTDKRTGYEFRIFWYYRENTK